VYTLELEYPKGKHAQYCDSITHCAVIDLFTHGIHASQNAHNSIILHDTRDLTFALALLGSHTLYTVKIASKPPV
jgi:hypothetical protein